MLLRVASRNCYVTQSESRHALSSGSYVLDRFFLLYKTNELGRTQVCARNQGHQSVVHDVSEQLCEFRLDLLRTQPGHLSRLLGGEVRPMKSLLHVYSIALNGLGLAAKNLLEVAGALAAMLQQVRETDHVDGAIK